MLNFSTFDAYAYNGYMVTGNYIPSLGTSKTEQNIIL